MIKIYKVVVLYDWSNTNPETESYLFENKSVAETFQKNKMLEIASDVFDVDDLDWVDGELVSEELEICCEEDGRICINDGEDYVNFFLLEDVIHTSADIEE